MAKKFEYVVDPGDVDVELKDAQGNTLCLFSFNPTDTNIVSRYKSVKKFLEEYKAEEEEESSGERLKKIEKEVCGQLDYLLGKNISDKIFDNIGAFTLSEDGKTYFDIVVECVADVIEKATKNRIDAKIKHLDKYIGKYKK